MKVFEDFKPEIHYSADIERAIIGACLIEKSAFGRLYGIVKPEIFYYDDHNVMFDCIQSMWENNEPIEILSVTHRLVKNGFEELQAGNTPYYVTRCTREVVSTANLEYWGMLLREMYIDREMVKMTQSGIGEKDTWVKMDEMQEKMLKLRQIKSVDDFKPIDELLIDLSKHMDEVKGKDLVGITTGFRTWDHTTGGLMPSEAYIIAARPAVGKSAFMGKMIMAQAKQGINVAVCSLEMSDKKITARLSSLFTEIEFWRIYRNRMTDALQAQNFYDMIHQMSSLPIRISDTAYVDIQDIKAKVAKLKNRGQIDILYIDYLQLIEAEEKANRNREQEVSKISRGLKLLAKEYSIPVVELCQLNRMSETVGDKKPKLHNLRESGSIEQDADGVVFLHRDFMSGIKTNQDGSSTENEADLIIAKWRDGVVTEYKIGFDGPRMKFYELDELQVSRPLIPVKKIESPKNFYETEKSFDDQF